MPVASIPAGPVALLVRTETTSDDAGSNTVWVICPGKPPECPRTSRPPIRSTMKPAP